jgi:hypothetical protein
MRCSLALREDHGLHELIATRVARIGSLHGGAGRIAADFAAAKHDGIPGELVALPALVAVHGVVAADDRGDFRTAGLQIFFQLGHVGGTAGGRCVAAISDGVDHEVFDSGGFRGIAKRGEVILMRMHAAIADEAEEVQALAFGFFESVHEHGHGGEFAIANALVDAGEVLIHDATGTEVQVADFAVAHLAVGQADVLTAGADGAARVGGVEVVVERGPGEQGGVAIGHGLGFAAGVDAPAVTDN